MLYHSLDAGPNTKPETCPSGYEPEPFKLRTAQICQSLLNLTALAPAQNPRIQVSVAYLLLCLFSLWPCSDQHLSCTSCPVPTLCYPATVQQDSLTRLSDAFDVHSSCHTHHWPSMLTAHRNVYLVPSLFRFPTLGHS